MFLLVVLFILPRTVVYGRSYEHSIDKKIDIDAFNCPKQCGKMAKQDESYQDVCTAYKNGGNCPEEEGEDYNGGEEHNRIVGGEEVQYHIPWLVLLAITAYDDTAQIMCGGSLINDRFILTAAHCPCMKNVGLCTRTIGKVEKTPIKIKDDVKPKQSVLAYVGVAQQKEQTPKKLLDQKSKSEEVEKLFIHPDLSTTEEFSTTPDILLVKIKPIQKFTIAIRPICLAHGDVQDVPPCSDDSIDVMVTETSKIKQFGGCATVAGWGTRYDPGKEDAICVTDNSFASPAKHRPCHQTNDNCSTSNIKDEQMSRKCKNIKMEMGYQAQQKNDKYKGLTYEQLARKAPIIILVGKKKKKYVCGKTKFGDERKDPKWIGWCATKLDKKDKIKEYGFCSRKCKDHNKTVRKLNVNLMTDKECETLTHEGDKLDPKREMCGGKKTFFPDFNVRVFKRQKKTEKTKEREKKESEGKYLKPTKYSYKYIPSTSKNNKHPSKLINMRTEIMRNISEEYQYKWFLGGKDACQVDSGGPLWRIMDVGKEKRAVLIGVVARGKGCADFNKPGLFSKVKANYDFIKKIAGKESKYACPK